MSDECRRSAFWLSKRGKVRGGRMELWCWVGKVCGVFVGRCAGRVGVRGVRWRWGVREGGGSGA